MRYSWIAGQGTRNLIKTNCDRTEQHCKGQVTRSGDSSSLQKAKWIKYLCIGQRNIVEIMVTHIENPTSIFVVVWESPHDHEIAARHNDGYIK